jgi:membrane protein required for colicin V production
VTVLLDVLVLVVLALAALHGALGGALRQLVQLGAALVGWLAARHLAAPVATGLVRWFPGFLARPGAAVLLFIGAFALVSLLGALVLRGTSVATVVRGPTDRAAGAVLGGAKGGLVAWVLLSALALAGGALPGRLGAASRGSEYATLARDHNLLMRIDPARARLLERVLRAAREAERKGVTRGEGAEARALLANPRVRALAEAGGEIDPVEAARLLDDPAVRELVDRIRDRSGRGE